MPHELYEYLIQTHDTKFKAWLFEREAIFPFLLSTLEFGSTFKIYLIDHYSAKMPLFLDYYSARHKVQVNFIPTAVLDSQTVSLLVQYVESPNSLQEEKIKAVRSLITNFIFRGLDYNPCFYYMESVVRNKNKVISDYTFRSAKAMITLHSMDVSTFLQNGSVVIDERILQLYKDKYSCNTIEEVAYYNSQEVLQERNIFLLDNLVDVTYLLLLKMALIRKRSGKGVIKKAAEFRDFMLNEFDVYFAREHQISWFYFSDLLDKFIPLQRNYKYPGILTKIRATAWDVLLLRLPEMMLSQGSPSEAVVPYVCSSEKSIKFLGDFFQLASLYTVPPYYHMVSSFTMNLSTLQAKIGTKSLDKLVKENHIWQEERQKKHTSGGLSPKDIAPKRIAELIQHLEDEVKLFCGS
jgi:hypothetical protein